MKLQRGDADFVRQVVADLAATQRRLDAIRQALPLDQPAEGEPMPARLTLAVAIVSLERAEESLRSLTP